ncbi:MAG: carboxylating nicotinate-nucleotide diphosphorylase [Chloroflexaceae bacterium]|nr:carboxylating nicotinate-nucleotide diphosphorylase [Chloroflexaceae bacterium]
MELSANVIREVVERALREDIGTGDLTTLAVIPASAQASGLIVMKEPGVVAGLPVLAAVFAAVDPTLAVHVQVAEGSHVEKGTVVAEIVGSARSLLTGERVALNLLQRMCGIATLTARYVEAVRGTKARILDTRKTTPGLRALEKYAVRMGGGTNHRFALYDGVMLKDNHLELLAAHGISAAEALRQAKAAVGPMVRVEIEVETVAAAAAVAAAGADMILLDNMPPAQLREAVQAVAGRALLEASGGITLDTVRAVAESGVDFISVGALTHSARALDISLDVRVN